MPRNRSNKKITLQQPKQPKQTNQSNQPDQPSILLVKNRKLKSKLSHLYSYNTELLDVITQNSSTIDVLHVERRKFMADIKSKNYEIENYDRIIKDKERQSTCFVMISVCVLFSILFGILLLKNHST
jgi:hypothetical protein